MFYCEVNTKLADGPRDIEGPHNVGFWQVNITRSGENGRFLLDDILIHIFLNIYVWYTLPGGFPEEVIDNNSSPAQVMAWFSACTKPLHEPMVSQFTDTYIDGLAQGCSNSSALAMELLHSCTQLSICDTGTQWVYRKLMLWSIDLWLSLKPATHDDLMWWFSFCRQVINIIHATQFPHR